MRLCEQFCESEEAERDDFMVQEGKTDSAQYFFLFFYGAPGIHLLLCTGPAHARLKVGLGVRLNEILGGKISVV